MNNVTLIGRLVRDPETRYSGEMAVTTFTLAVDRQGKDKGADFIRIVSFGKTAELCEKYLAKGRQVAIQGRINTGSYEKDGQKIYTTDVIADRVKFLGSKKDNEPKEDVYEGFQALEDDSDFIPF